MQMKKLLIIFVVLLLSNTLSAQTDNFKIALDNFCKNYNAGKYGAIFNDFSFEMKQALPLDKTTEFFSNLDSQFGKIGKTEFIGLQKGSYASYKSQFDKAVLSLNISFDEQNKINGFFIKPYLSDGVSANKPKNGLSVYPTKIAETIFSKMKAFPNNTQFSIAIIDGASTNYYGVIKKRDSIIPIENQDQIFEIGSITKVFTSTVLASLVKQKKIDLNGFINPYFPFLFKDNTRISFLSLANQTSGLPRLPENFDLSNNTNPYKNYTQQQLYEYLKDSLRLDSKPSTSYSYSNLGVGLLGYTLGLSQKTSFQKLLEKLVFEKYNMNNSFTSNKGLRNKLVHGLSSEGELVSNWDFDVLFGAGGILSTSKDLAKFAMAQFNVNDSVLALTRCPSFTINDRMKIGLGWHIINSKNTDYSIVWHNGGTGGYSSSMGVDVKNRKAVIILSNVSSSNDSIDELCFDLIKEIEY